MHCKLSENNDTSPLKICGGERKGKNIEKTIIENGDNRADYKWNSNTGEGNNTIFSIRQRVRTQGVKRVRLKKTLTE